MRSSKLRVAAALAGFALIATACGSSDPEPEASPSAAAVNSSEICDTDDIVAAVQGGAEDGTLEGMADAQVATAASNNPVLTTLTAAVTAAGVGDTLNGVEALTVFAPTDCAFAALDPATLQAALDDPNGLLTTVLGFHVIVGERIASADLAARGEIATFTGEMLSVDGMIGGQANILVPDIQTANATVHLIDSVMLPPSITGAGMTEMNSAEICDADGLVAAVQGGAEAGTLEGMADAQVATAASNNPVLTTLTAAVGAAGLGDTLNGAAALTVFAPTDCAFAALDPATLQAALDDPNGLLTTVLGFHVLTERLDFDAIKGAQTFTTFTGEELTVSVDGDVVTLGGQAKILVPSIQTANATVYLIDSVMLPPSVTG